MEKDGLQRRGGGPSQPAPQPLKLRDGSRVGVVGGGPAGSFFAYFLLEMANRYGTEVRVDVYEPRDFSVPGPSGCNMCGGIVSESLTQHLAAEGITLPPTVVQRGLDSYVLHTDVGSVKIDTPLREKRIAAVHRGAGPRGIRDIRWGGLDGFLLEAARQKGAQVVRGRVEAAAWVDGRPQICARAVEPQAYDLLAVAVGVNSSSLRLFQGLASGYEPPQATKTVIRDYYLGEDIIGRYLGSSMHVFLLNLPRLEFAAIIPKGDYVTICLLGEDIDAELVQSFLTCPVVKDCMPPGWDSPQVACQCSPRINVHGAVAPFADRLVFIGDCGVTRLYKDGIGAAYRTAKAAATTVVFQGIAGEDFRKHYWPACRAIARDNEIGKLVFAVTRQIQQRRFARRAVLRMTAAEQGQERRQRTMSMVLWDMFT